jgi:UDP-glucose 4-epimerase
MIILVTGGAGFIGSTLVNELVNADHQVRVIDDLSVNERNVASLKSIGVDLHKANVGDFNQIKDLFQGVDVVFHLAAMNRAQRSIEDPIGANQVNINGTLHCLEASRQAGVKKFVNISSSSVYAGQRDQALQEDMPLAPPHPYGVGKLAGEHYARVYHKIYSLPVVTLRYFSVFGPRQLGFINRAGVVAKFIHHALRGQPLQVYGNGSQARNFSYVLDVVRKTILASEVEEAVGHTINIASEREISVNYLVEVIKRLCKSDSEIVFSPLPPGDPPRNPANVSKAKKLLNYEPQFTFEEGIAQTVDWYRKNIGGEWNQESP